VKVAAKTKKIINITANPIFAQKQKLNIFTYR